MGSSKEQILKQFGLRVRDARQKKHMSQQQLADILSISSSHVSNIEMGKVNVGLEILYHLATDLDTSVDSLLMLKVSDKNGIACYDAIVELFEDCSPSEAEILYKIVSEVKGTLRASRK